MDIEFSSTVPVNIRLIDRDGVRALYVNDDLQDHISIPDHMPLVEVEQVVRTALELAHQQKQPYWRELLPRFWFTI